MLKNFWKDESGQDLVEYALVVGVVALGAVGGISTAAGHIKDIWTALNGLLGAQSAKIT